MAQFLGALLALAAALVSAALGAHYGFHVVGNGADMMSYVWAGLFAIADFTAIVMLFLCVQACRARDWGRVIASFVVFAICVATGVTTAYTALQAEKALRAAEGTAVTNAADAKVARLRLRIAALPPHRVAKVIIADRKRFEEYTKAYRERTAELDAAEKEEEISREIEEVLSQPPPPPDVTIVGMEDISRLLFNTADYASQIGSVLAILLLQSISCLGMYVSVSHSGQPKALKQPKTKRDAKVQPAWPQNLGRQAIVGPLIMVAPQPRSEPVAPVVADPEPEPLPEPAPAAAPFVPRLASVDGKAIEAPVMGLFGRFLEAHCIEGTRQWTYLDKIAAEYTAFGGKRDDVIGQLGKLGLVVAPRGAARRMAVQGLGLKASQRATG